MNGPQQKTVETPVSSVDIDDSANSSVQITDKNAVSAAASPAFALQMKLTEELQPTPLFQEAHGVLKMIASFAVACAGTWIFGALLYLQV